MNTEDDEFNRIEMESKVRQVMQQAVWDSATRVPEGDIRALKHRIHTLEGEVIGYKRILDAQPEQEPVAIALNTGTKQGIKWLKNVEHGESLYTTPPHRKPLTDEKIDAIWDAVITPSNHIREFVRAIEAAHGIKE